MKSRTNAFVLVVLAMSISMAAQGNPSQDLQPKHKTYKLVDLGTFGGPASHFENVGSRPINNEGTATGFGDTPVADPWFPNCFEDCYVNHTFQWRNGAVTDLGSLPGVNNSGPNDINDKGVVTGISQDGVYDPALGWSAFVAVVWKEGQIINLGTLGGLYSYANALNNSGTVVGFATNDVPDSFGLGDFCEVPPMSTQMRASIWQNGVIRELGTLGGSDSCALYVNERGQAAGHSFTNAIVNPSTGLPTIDPFLWDGRKMLDLGSLGGTIGLATAINDPGQVVGVMNLAGDAIAHPFLWSHGRLTDLGTLGGDNGQAAWINNAGDVVGYADLPGSTTHHGFFWSKGKLQDVGTVGARPCTSAFRVNSEGQAVGRASDCMGGALRAFLWEKGSIIDLNAFVPPSSDLTLAQALYINDRGEIAGDAVLANRDTHAFLLVPDGDCDTSCEQRIAESNADAALVHGYEQVATYGAQLPVNPIERIRNRKRQRFGLPGSHAPLQD